MNQRPTLNTRKASEFLGCSRSYIYQLFETGRIEGFRLGEKRGIRLYLDSVQAFLMQRMESDY